MCLGAAWLARCLANDLYLYEETQLRRRAFKQLVKHYRPHVRNGRTIEVEEKVLTFLYVCAQGAGWREAKHRYRHLLSTITTYVHRNLA
ncbi:hypothetical protein BU23DRAFT_468943 [Bimuria novae-zelandiae CBS 107.79]|uniref:DUF8040 domain-containing protein n=1 Tax=Bimuria novae-zelandiae CBS 107.79 TaxID=1447943 RepID=A0A6A5V4R9_9PLEO|nr:hypothetical protein BU23DRAFT_468943 [Bimuria novae-zelandiae CBS 107.79]